MASTRHRTRRWIAVLAVLQLAWAGPALAQGTRTEVLRQAREEKQRALQPSRPNKVETTLKMLEREGIPLITRDGLYLKFGSLTTGSGFAFGSGYRTRRLFRREGVLDFWGGATVTGYWAAEVKATLPALADGHLMIEGSVRRHEYPQEDYFGLGPHSARGNQSDYKLLRNSFSLRSGVRPVSKLLIGGGVEYIEPRVSNGTDDRVPGINEVFDEASAPGVSRQPDFVRTSAFVDVDYRRPLNARRGGWYRVDFSHFDDRDYDAYSFNRVDVDLRQFIGILSERRVFMARAAFSTSETSAGQEMPFYLMPWLGGNDSLRGFRDYRFRGPHAMLLQGEYRFEIWSGLDGALFYDAGKVALSRADLDFDDLQSNYGIGFRFNTNNGMILRVDGAFGSRDGKHLWIVFGGVF